MENAGAVTFLEDYVFRSRVTDFSREARGETILHEMAHMWFGDLVTMRWWDDLWLNESFATWAGTAAQAEATRWTARVDHVRHGVEGVGVPAGPAAVDAPDRRRHPGHPRGRGELRRHHLRQGRVRAEAARRVRRAGQLPGRRAPLLRRALVGQRDARRPAVRARGGLRPRPDGLVARVAGDGRRQHAAAVVHRRRGRAFHVVLGPPGGAPRRIPCCARTASRSASTRRTDGVLRRTAYFETDISGAQHAGARAGRPAPARPGARQRRRPDLRQDPARRPLAADRWSAPSASSTSSLPAALCWAAAWDMSRDGEMAARDYVRLVLGGVGLGAGHQRRADAAAAGRAGGRAGTPTRPGAPRDSP